MSTRRDWAKDTYGFPRPGAEDAETQLAVDIEVGVYALSMVLNKFDLRGHHGVAVGDVKLQLEQLVAVDRILWGDNVDEEAEQIIVLEEADVCGGGGVSVVCCATGPR